MRSSGDSTGIITATGLPRRVTVIVPPSFSSRRRCSLSRFFSSRTLTGRHCGYIVAAMWLHSQSNERPPAAKQCAAERAP